MPHAEGFPCPGVEAPRTMPTISLRRTAAARPRAAGARAAAPQRRRAGGPPPPLRALPPHAADGRGRARLRGRRRRAPRVRAVPPAAPRGARPGRSSCTRPSTSARCGSRAAPPDGAVHYASGRRGPRHAARQHRPPAGGGVRLPVGHRQPPGVHRPLPQGVAADARGVAGPRRRRALPPGRALRPLRLLRPEPRRARRAVPHRRRRAAAASTTGSRRSTSGRSSRTRAGRGSSTSTRPSRRCPPTASWRR